MMAYGSIFTSHDYLVAKFTNAVGSPISVSLVLDIDRVHSLPDVVRSVFDEVRAAGGRYDPESLRSALKPFQYDDVTIIWE